MKLRRDLYGKVIASLQQNGMAPAGVTAARLDADSLELGEAAEQLGVTRELLLKGLANLANMPFIDLREIGPAPEAIETVNEHLARKYGCLPLFLNHNELTVAVGNPRSWVDLDELRTQLDAFDVIFVLSDEPLIAELHEIYYPSEAEAVVRDYLRQSATDGYSSLQSLSEKAPVIKMVEAILSRAEQLGASDVHLEPFAKAGVVRFRVDGLMSRIFNYAPALHEALISRLKVISDLNIVERQRPQDGRFSMQLSETRKLDARISFLRMVHGEKAVIRLLRGESSTLRGLDTIGMPPREMADMMKLLSRPYGMMLVTGPTGSGKTSTLYASLQYLNNGLRNLITLEDPVEYPLVGINQVPVKPDLDLTFAAALRSVLRQDPDVIMIGEIRDLETAEIAIRASLTGHMVLATLHTNSATETITRLLEMGLDGGNLAPALLGVVAQRLVRKLCTCHTYGPASAELWSALGVGFIGDVPQPMPRGCVECQQTGYRGRQVLFELLVADDNIKRTILGGATSAELRDAAMTSGMRPMLSAGVRAVLAGQTTIEEVLRVVSAED